MTDISDLSVCIVGVLELQAPPGRSLRRGTRAGVAILLGARACTRGLTSTQQGYDRDRDVTAGVFDEQTPGRTGFQYLVASWYQEGETCGHKVFADLPSALF